MFYSSTFCCIISDTPCLKNLLPFLTPFLIIQHLPLHHLEPLQCFPINLVHPLIIPIPNLDTELLLVPSLPNQFFKRLPIFPLRRPDSLVRRTQRARVLAHIQLMHSLGATEDLPR